MCGSRTEKEDHPVIAERSEAERGLVILTYACSRVAVSAPRTSNACHGFGPRVPPASLSYVILLGVSKYVAIERGIFSLTSIALELEAS